MKSTILKLSDYTAFDKANILYNHLHHYNVPMEYCAYIISEQRYLTIINHKNYSPRLIEWMTLRYTESNDIDAKDYYEEFLTALYNPSQIWDKAFTKHISDYSRYILYTLFFIEDSVLIDDLKDISYHWINSEQKISKSKYSEVFDTSLKELENSFIRIGKTCWL